jgi:hypothetical protein
MEYFKGNKNIMVDHENAMITLQPYTVELTVENVCEFLRSLQGEKFKLVYSVDLGGDFNFNGLFEINTCILNQGGVLSCNYTGEDQEIIKTDNPFTLNDK